MPKKMRMYFLYENKSPQTKPIHKLFVLKVMSFAIKMKVRKDEKVKENTKRNIPIKKIW